ncbi:MAG: hypothetical protein Kow0099_02270 [Candidatus Abyssubacteria bacterium]
MAASKSRKAEYRRCTCGKVWNTRDDLLRDAKVKIVGYQPDFVSRKYNHFLFQHKAKGCGQYFGIRSSDFADLREKGCPNELCTGQENCPGYCLNTLDLRVCSVACRNASDRVLAAKLRDRKLLRGLLAVTWKSPSKGNKGRSSARSK